MIDVLLNNIQMAHNTFSINALKAHMETATRSDGLLKKDDKDTKKDRTRCGVFACKLFAKNE